MKRNLRARSVVLGLAVAGILSLGGLAAPASAAGGSGQQEVAAVDQLRSEAYKALRDGQFDRTNALLDRAASMSHDPADQRMAGWTHRFEDQRQGFATERHKQFEKALGNVKTLADKGHLDYSVDAARGAYLLAEDKQAFRNEAWVDKLVQDAIARANGYDQDEQWVKSLRLYSDLAALEPANPEWKDKLKLVTRRVRLLALYTPDVLKHLQDGDVKERDEVETLLHPTTQPTTKPSDASDDNAFKIDWHETLKGVRMDMLWDALRNANDHYYRDVDYKTLAHGGLKGIRTLVETKGLENAFPKLADPQAKEAFLQVIDKWTQKNKTATANTEQLTLSSTLTDLRTQNHRTVGLPDEVLVSEFADGAFGELDPFSSMIWPSDIEEFNKSTQGEFSGVGIQIQSDEDGSLKVVSPLEDTPAYHAGIKAGDIITHINGKSAKGISTNQAVRTITGPAHTGVTLTVRSPDGHVKDYHLTRETIHVASVKGWVHLPGGGWDYNVDPDSKIGYIRLTNFTRDSKDELDQAIDRMKHTGTHGLILDLRYNPGGLLMTATQVADKFLRDGVIVSTHPDRNTGDEPTVANASPEADDCNWPLIVLVNQYSASASEIVSGALKDNHRALIVGERTFGKGSVQKLFRLSDGSAYLKLTTSHYYLPSGKCIHREENSKEWGVAPDVTVEMTPDQMRAAIDARQDLDVLRDANAPAGGEQPKLKEKAAKAPKKDLLSSDPQLSAAVLMLKFELAGVDLMGNGKLANANINTNAAHTDGRF
jgi:carboxyl-terminal processing protease